MAAHASDPFTIVLHVVGLKGFAQSEEVAEATGLGVRLVERHLQRAEVSGLVVHRDGRIRGWRLTPAGRDEHRSLLAGELAAAGCRAAVEAAYSRFLALNLPFKELCTEWQLGDRPPRGIDELVALDDRRAAVTAELSRGLGRFGTYDQRFISAIGRLLAGDVDAFTKPLSSSYHDVWMELHQDLLLTLDRGRSAADGS